MACIVATACIGNFFLSLHTCTKALVTTVVLLYLTELPFPPVWFCFRMFLFLRRKGHGLDQI